MVDQKNFFDGGYKMAQRSDLSGTITTGGTAQNISASLLANGFAFQNVSDTDMWIRIGGTAAADSPSMKIPAGALYETPANERPNGQVSVICATTGKKFSAWSW